MRYRYILLLSLISFIWFLRRLQSRWQVVLLQMSAVLASLRFVSLFCGSLVSKQTIDLIIFQDTMYENLSTSRWHNTEPAELMFVFLCTFLFVELFFWQAWFVDLFKVIGVLSDWRVSSSLCHDFFLATLSNFFRTSFVFPFDRARLFISSA